MIQHYSSLRFICIVLLVLLISVGACVACRKRPESFALLTASTVLAQPASKLSHSPAFLLAQSGTVARIVSYDTKTLWSWNQVNGAWTQDCQNMSVRGKISRNGIMTLMAYGGSSATTLPQLLLERTDGSGWDVVTGSQPVADPLWNPLAQHWAGKQRAAIANDVDSFHTLNLFF
jgi:hypothetical protein